MRRYPLHFRKQLLIDVEDQQVAPFSTRMEKWQEDDFAVMDPCLRWLAGIGEKPYTRRFWFQRARGHAKTSDLATSITWLLWASVRKVDGIGVAEDVKQAGLLKDAMEKIALHNPWLRDTLEYQRKKIVNKVTKSSIEIWSSDVASSWGTVPDFVVADEFTHWSNQVFWTSVFSSFGKREGMLAVMCNAGWGRDWRWDAKINAIKNPLWYHSANEGCVATWLSQEMLDEQRAVLPPAEYDRLWQNIWQETGGEFVTLSEAEACRKDGLVERQHTPKKGMIYVATLDYAEKTDRTVGVVMHQHGPEIIVDRMDVICPKVTKVATRVDWCEKWMRNVQDRFAGADNSGKVYFVIDKFQLLGVKQGLLDLGYNVDEFEFAGGIGNWKLGICLRQLIIHQRVRWYKDCGVVRDLHGNVAKTPLDRDDLEAELASLVVTQYANGKRWRFDHLQDGVHHDDRAFALGAGCLWLVEHSGGCGEWGIVTPDEHGMWRI